MMVAPTLLLAALLAGAPDPPPTPAPAPPSAERFFAVEFRSGPNWDSAKPPGEQPFFKQHSESLKRLRGEGRIRLGGRYADKGFLIFAGASESEIRALIDSDVSVAHGTFVYDVNEFRLFYAGCVGAAPQ
jgi:hypothetical protein